MHTTLEFTDLLRLIDERAEAFRTAVASTPDLDIRVPTCPDWTIVDLVRHLGTVHRTWARTVAIGPAAERPVRPSEDIEDGPAEREPLLAWSAESTRELLEALRAAGPDSECWTWWPDSQTPQNARGVARHQVQEAMVHAYDAQIAVAAEQPLPSEAALDSVEEFLYTSVATTSPWPHEPATIDFHVAEGRSWRLTLSAEGARATRLPEGDDDADKASFSTRSTAGDLVLVFYSRISLDTIQFEGDRHVFERLVEWEPED